MKKLILGFVLIAMSVFTLVGCKKNGSVKDDSAKDDSKISIVTTIFPEYDWVKQLTKGNENVDVEMLLDKGVDLHSFQPSTTDIVKLSSCDMLIYVGGESDEWVEAALKERVNKDMVIVNLLDILGDNVKEEEIVEGMQGEEEEEDSQEDSNEGPEYDEHVWLSVKNAKIICNHIADELAKMDSENKLLYESNLNAYISELDKLDGEYESVVNNASVKTILFGDRFPFRYMTDDYGLEYYAAFVGCSADSEASFDTITFLAGKVDELGLKTILQIETADGKLSETIRNNTANKDQNILVLNSMQSVTKKDVADGQTYVKIMKDNLEVLTQALK